MPRSYANGPGARAVVWVQGCSLQCSGCFNPTTHAYGGGPVDCSELADQVALIPGIEGITVTGGEPLQQMDGLLPFLSSIRERTAYTVVVFTGYDMDEVRCLTGGPELLALVDVLIAGRYQARSRVAKGLQGSRNKLFHFGTSAYTRADFDAVPAAEVIISTDGSLVATGIDPLVRIGISR